MTIKKLFLGVLSFLLIFSLVFVTIESVDPEPAYASSQFACFDDSGRPIGYRITASDNDNRLTIQQFRHNGSQYTYTSANNYYTNVQSAVWGSTKVTAAMMDTKGNLWAVARNGGPDLVYIDKNTGNGTVVMYNLANSGAWDGAGYFEHNGYEFLGFGKGMMGSGQLIEITGSNLTSSSSYDEWNFSSNQVSMVSALKDTEDFAWIEDPSGLPTYSGVSPKIIGYNNDQQQVVLGYVTSFNASTQSMTMTFTDTSVSKPSDWTTNNASQVMGFGGSEIYILHNNNGEVRKLGYSSGSWSWSAQLGADMGSSSNVDAAACHGGSPTTTFNPTVTATQGSCDGTNREIDITLNNTSSNKAVTFYTSYTINGGSSTNLSTQQVNSASTNTSLKIPGQTNGANVVISWYAEYTTENLREPTSGTTSLSTITIDASSCSPTPTSKSSSSSISAAFGSCSSGSATSTLTITNSDSSTVYYYVDYSINGGTYVNASTNLSVSAGATNTSLSTSVSHGENITWRFKASDTNNDFTGLSYSTLTASSNLDCPVIDTTGASSFGSCSAGSKTSTFTMSNSSSANTAAFFRVQYSINGGSFENAVTNQSVGINSSETTSVSVPHGSTIQWQYEISNTSNTFTGTYTQEATSSAVDCPTIDISTSQSLGSCSAGSSTSTLTLSNSNSANSTAYFYVEYSIDGGSNWNEKASNQSVVQNGTESLTQSVTHGTAITWRYKSSSTSGSFTGDFTTLSESATVDCPVLDTSVSSSLGSCGSGTALSTFIINNSSSANTTAYFQVEYKLSSESSYTSLASNQAVAPDGTTSFNKAVPHGENITWQYRTSSTSNTFSGGYSFGGTSAIVDCPVLATSVSFSFGSCSAGSKTSTFTMSNSSSANTAAFFRVQYSINGGDFVTSTLNSQVAIDSSSTVSATVPHGSTIQWQYETSNTSNTFTGTYTQESTSSAVDCPVIDTTGASSFGSCSAGSKTSTFTMSNSSSANTAAFFRVQYSINGGSFENAVTNQSVGINSSETTSVSVPHGSTIQWQYEISNTSNTFTGTYTQEATSSAVDCPIYAVIASHSVTNCTNNGVSQAGTEGRIVLSIDNSGSNADITLLIQKRSTNAVSGNVGDWDYFNTDITGGSSGTSISAGVAETTFRLDDIATGTGIEHRYSIDGGSTWTEVGSKLTVSCVSVTTSLGSCSSELTQTPTITLNSGADATSNVFFRVEYSIDGGSTWTELENDLEVAIDSSQTLTGPALADGESIDWRYSSRKASGSHDSSLWVTSDTDIPGIDPTLTYTASCIVPTTTTTTTTSTTTTTTTSTTTTTTTVPNPIFKPVIQNSRSCSQAGGGSYSLSINNSNSTVDMTINIKIFVDRVKVFVGTYSVAAGDSFNLTTISGAPEDSLYRIRFIVKDTLSGVNSKGGFRKTTDCVSDSLGTSNKILGVIQPTTTTIPQSGISFQEESDTDVLNEDIPNLPIIEPVDEEDINFCEDMIFDSSDECKAPLSSDEGNDAFIWDNYDEGVYLTDGSYEVKYLYEEDNIFLAATGINTDLYVLIITIFSIAGVLLLYTARRGKLVSQPKNIDLVFKNAFKLKNRLEKMFNQVVSINIDFNKINPYGVHFGSIGLHKESVNRVNKELIDAFENLKVISLNNKSRDLDKLKNEFMSNLDDLSSDLFKVVFINKPLESVKYNLEAKVSFFESFKFRFSKSLSMGFGILFLSFGLYTAGYLVQQVYLSNNMQIQAQTLLQELFQKNDNEINKNSNNVEQINFTDNSVDSFTNDVPTLITETENTNEVTNIVAEFFNSLGGNESNQTGAYQPEIFGYLEIPKINLQQYVVYGTNDEDLKMGPGYYVQTSKPGYGGNVAIAGHRTTFGAPFRNVDELGIGDEISLIFGATKFIYQIDEVKIVEPVGSEYLLYNRGDERITLTTCHPKYSDRQRLVISGKIIKTEQSA